MPVNSLSPAPPLPPMNKPETSVSAQVRQFSMPDITLLPPPRDMSGKELRILPPVSCHDGLPQPLPAPLERNVAPVVQRNSPEAPYAADPLAPPVLTTQFVTPSPTLSALPVVPPLDIAASHRMVLSTVNGHASIAASVVTPGTDTSCLCSCSKRRLRFTSSNGSHNSPSQAQEDPSPQA